MKVCSAILWGIGCDPSALTLALVVAMPFAMKNGQICFSLQKLRFPKGPSRTENAMESTESKFATAAVNL